MKSSKHELTYFFLTILVLVFASGVYFLFGNRHTATVATEPANALVQAEHSDTQAAEDAVTKAEEEPSSDKVTEAQTLLQQLSDNDDKTSLQTRLDAVSTEITNETVATTAIETAETSLSSTDIQTAQEAINHLTNEKKKAELQTRLDAVTAQVPTS